MSAIRTAAFSFRDFLESILPMLVAICLFVPYVKKIDSIDFAIVLVALFGYVISPPVNYLANKAYKHFPYLGKELKKINEANNWCSNNWNYDSLFYEISSDEREYIYLTAAYASCFRSMSLYLLIYVLVQIIYIIINIYNHILKNDFFFQVIYLKTPMFGGWELPTLVVLIFSIVFYIFLIKNYLNELNFLFHETEGQYVVFSKKIHQKTGGIAKAVWGTVFNKKNGVVGARIKLIDSNNTFETTTDLNGRFQFVDVLPELLNKNCKIEVKSDNDLCCLFDIQVTTYQVPEYTIRFK